MKINKNLLSVSKILYVEDESKSREKIALFLQELTTNLYVAKNGKEGIKLYNQYKPDIIITDIQMPIKNGLDMIKEINCKDIPIIITTAYSDADYFLKAIELDVFKFIIKPINLMDLIKSLQDALYAKYVKNKLFEKDSLLKIVDENVLISVTDKKGLIIDVSSAFCKMTGYSKEELIGSTHKILKHKDTPESFYKKMWHEINKGKIFKATIKNRKKDGDIYWAKLTITPVINEKAEIVNFTAVRQDITNKMKLEELIIEDELTKLYNRRYFTEILNREIKRIKRAKSNISLIFIDIDYFKKYNDYYGHQEGDKILQEISILFKNICSRSTDYAFRLGGEEFCIIFSGLSKKKSIEFSEKIVNAVENLNILHYKSECSKYVTISAGLIIKSYAETLDIESLYKEADDALYIAKSKGRNQVYI